MFDTILTFLTTVEFAGLPNGVYVFLGLFVGNMMATALVGRSLRSPSSWF